MSEERKEVEFQIEDNESDERTFMDDLRDSIPELIDGILDSLGGLESDMRDTSKLARYMGVFDNSLSTGDRLGNGLVLIPESTVNGLKELLEPYRNVENVGVRIAARSLYDALFDGMVHGGVVVFSSEYRDSIEQGLEDLIVTIEGVDDRLDEDEDDDDEL